MAQSYLPAQSTIRAGIYMVLAMASFVTNDTFVKSLSGTVPVGEIVAIRGAFASILIAGICLWQGVLGSVQLIFSKHVLFRAMLDLVGTLLFITALMHMPIANLTSIMQAVPLVVALFAAIFLGEKVGLRRSVAIMAGIIGVLLIVKPSPSTFSIYEAFALTIVFSLAVRDIVTRRIPGHVPSQIVALANAVFVTLGGFGLALYEGFSPVSTGQVATLAAAALFLGLGYVFMVMTLRTGELSATAPFRYSIVVFAILSGVVVFGEIPDRWAVLGIVLIVASGLYAAHREAKLSRLAKLKAAEATG
jgi:S-adenosylmethionine uptake transporter